MRGGGGSAGSRPHSGATVFWDSNEIGQRVFFIPSPLTWAICLHHHRTLLLLHYSSQPSPPPSSHHPFESSAPHLTLLVARPLRL